MFLSTMFILSRISIYITKSPQNIWNGSDPPPLAFNVHRYKLFFFFEVASQSTVMPIDESLEFDCK